MPLVSATGPPLVDVLDDLVSRFVLNCPEEEKESFERLFFQIESAFWFYDDHYREKYPDQYPTLNLKQFAEKLFRHCEVLKPYKERSAELFAKFTDYKGRVPTCGAAILDTTLTKLLLVRSWNGTTWGFPKGKINKGEADHECAIREVEEEIGLDITHLVDVGQYLEHSYGKGTTMKLFLVCGVDERTHLETRTKKEIGAIVWHSLADLGSEAAKKDRDMFIVQQLLARIKKWAAERRKALAGGGGGKKQAKAAASATVAAAGATTSCAECSGAAPAAPAPQAPPPGGFQFGYERERVDVSGGGVIEGGQGGRGKGARERASVSQQGGRAVPLDNKVTFGADSKAKGWSVKDMFRTNEQKFNLQSTYSYELYTTSLSGKPSTCATQETTQAARVRRAAQPPPMQTPATPAGLAAVDAGAPMPASSAASEGSGSQRGRGGRSGRGVKAAAAKQGSARAGFSFDHAAIMATFDATVAARQADLIAAT